MSNVVTHTAPVAPATEQLQHVRVRTHLIAAVVVTLLCFAPTGVAAVVQAGNVRTRLALGDLDGARRASAAARRLVWASVAITALFLLVVVVGAGGYSDTH
jgi:predicted secreted protein